MTTLERLYLAAWLDGLHRMAAQPPTPAQDGLTCPAGTGDLPHDPEWDGEPGRHCSLCGRTSA